MTKFDELLNEVRELVSQEECVKEYFRLKVILDSNEELKSLDAEMKKHQKAMCENKDNDEIYLKEKSLYESLKNQIETNPVWLNFQTVKEEVYSLLVDIKNVLG